MKTVVKMMIERTSITPSFQLASISAIPSSGWAAASELPALLCSSIAQEQEWLATDLECTLLSKLELARVSQ